MLTLQKGFDIAAGHVISKYKHPHYQRTLELAREYRALITGKDLEFMLRRFDRRESEADFEQANRIAQQITPAITSALMNPARRLGGVKPVVDRMDYGKDNDPKADALREGIEAFHSGIGVDEYLSLQVDPSDADPNGYTILTFDDFDERFEKPQVYPVHVGCENVYDAPRLNGELQFLWLGFNIKYIITEATYNVDGSVSVPAQTADGKRYVLYIDNHHILFEQVKKDTVPAVTIGKLFAEDGATQVEITKNAGVTFTDGERVKYYFRPNKEELFEVTFYEQKSGIVPAYALGCVPDQYTGGATFVNRWHTATPFLKKTLKSVRELDLQTALHTHLQRIEVGTPCDATSCNKGTLPDGQACTACKGTGNKATQTTTQDHLVVPMPRDIKDLVDITKLVHYVPLPVEVIVQLREIVKDNCSDAFKAVYGYDIYRDGKVGKTVEEVQSENQAQYDALSPLTTWRERTRTRIVKVYANYNDMGEGLIVQYDYPSDLGFETGAQILGLMKLGVEGGASSDYLANLNIKLDTWTFSDDPVALARIKTQARFNPFPGRKEDTIMALISGGKTTERSALVWTERATIFSKAEEKAGGPMKFYGLAEMKQNEIVNTIVDEMLAELKEQKEAAMLPLTGVDEETDPETGLPLEEAA